MTMALTQVTTGGVDENINIDNNTLKVDGTTNRVGIGTASPSTTCDISGTKNVISGVSSASNYHLRIQNPANDNGEAVGLSFGLSTGGDIGASIYHERKGASSYGDLIFATKPAGGNNQERLRIDSSGRLLIGTTTEGEVAADNLTIEDSGNCGMTIRSSTTGAGGIYFSDATSGAGEYDGLIAYSQGHRFMQFFTAQSERMRIDSSGRLLVGKSSGSYKLDIGGVSNPQIRCDGTSSSGQRGLIFAYNGTNFGSVGQNPQTGDLTIRSGESGQTGYYITLETGATERMRVDQNGKVSIGTSVATADLNVYGTASGVLIQNSNTGTGSNNGLLFGSWGGLTGYVWNYENDNISFGTNNVERMRLTSDGRLNVGHQAGATNTKAYFNSSGIQQTMYVQATGSGSTYGIYSYVYGGNSTQYALYGQVNTQSTQSSGGILGYSINSNTYGIIGYWSGSSYFSLYGNGVVAGSSFTSVSDSRLKDVDSNLTGCLSKLANIQPVKYTWKENSQQRRSVGEGVEIGMLAQEVQAQFPELVASVNNGQINGSNPETLNEQLGTTLHIDYSRMTAVLVQALKEAKERIETLETKVAALEAAA